MVNNFYVDDTLKSIVKEKGTIFWDTDSIGNYICFLQKDSTSKPIFNYNNFVKKHPYTRVINLKTNKKNSCLAITTSNRGKINKTILIKDILENKIIDSIQEVYSFEWFNDNTIIYTKNNKNLRSNKLFLHKLFYSQINDSLLLDENKVTMDLQIKKHGNYLFCEKQSLNENEIFFINSEKQLQLTSLYPIKEHKKYSVKVFNKNIYLKYYDNNKLTIYKISTNNFDREIVYQKKIKQEPIDFVITKDFIIYSIREKSNLILKYGELNSKKLTKLKLPDDYVFRVNFVNKGDLAFKNNDVYFIYTNPKLPQVKYKFNIISKNLTLIEKTLHSKSININNFAFKKVFAKSTTRKKIPITIIENKLKKNIHKGLVLKVYGAYGAYYGDGFDIEDAVLLSKGYTIAYAHVRGGSAYGTKWYNKGKLKNKINSINDYITCAKYLIEKKYTTSKYLVAYGNSAGGLIVAATINEYPKLFKAAILDHAFVDVLTTMCNDSLPLTTIEYNEWGNPNYLPNYEYMKKYSPYQNIKNNKYPNMLCLSGFNDEQTPYWQITKYFAKIKEYNQSSNEKFYLLTDFFGGHYGNPKEKQWIKNISIICAFIHDSLFF